MDEKFAFDDVLLIPQYSDLDSRSEVDISTSLPFVNLNVPIISSAMDRVTERSMQVAMELAGGLGIHHRFQINERELIESSKYGPVAVSPSMGEYFLDRLARVNPNAIAKIDVAHGNSKHALDYAEEASRLGLSVISGNVVTPSAAYRYKNVGVETICVGIGPGAACSTRVVAGVGYPQLSAIQEIHGVYPELSIISDGGIKSSGDIVKALAAGADAVIIGSLLAGTTESPGEAVTQNGNLVKEFRGMAAPETLREAGKEVNPEGVSGVVPYRGLVKDVIDELAKGIRAGFAYLGARNIQELRKNAKWVRITQNGIREGEPRI